jgi:hypothetical protein
MGYEVRIHRRHTSSKSQFGVLFAGDRSEKMFSGQRTAGRTLIMDFEPFLLIYKEYDRHVHVEVRKAD